MLTTSATASGPLTAALNLVTGRQIDTESIVWWMRLSVSPVANPQPTRVTEIPIYDIAAKCDRALGLAGCVEAEHASLGALHFWWRKISDQKAKEYCVTETSAAPFLNYTHLMH